MKIKLILLVYTCIILFSCNKKETVKYIPEEKPLEVQYQSDESSKKDLRVYNEIWKHDFSGVRKNHNDYDGLWISWQDLYYKLDYVMYELLYNIKNNFWFNCVFVNGYDKKTNKYGCDVIFRILEERDIVEEYESYGKGLTGVTMELPSNYETIEKSILVLEPSLWLKQYKTEEVVDYGIFTDAIKESQRLLPEKAMFLSIDEIYKRQNSDEVLNKYNIPDHFEGLWYIPTAQGEASEEDFVNTKAILIIGKDERHNPGWYHVVIYYDSGDPERGWVCEWGAAEIAEKTIEVQLSHISEGKPYTITLKEENGRRWIETTNEAATVKGQQFIRILPLK